MTAKTVLVFKNKSGYIFLLNSLKGAEMSWKSASGILEEVRNRHLVKKRLAARYKVTFKAKKANSTKIPEVSFFEIH